MRTAMAFLIMGMVAPITAMSIPLPGLLPRQDTFPQPNQLPGQCSENLQLPENAKLLPGPSANDTLLLIALGTGTQNYTCTSSTATEKPKSVGAVAELRNITCAVAKGDTDAIDRETAVIGKHYFLDLPDFDIPKLGNAIVNKTHNANSTNMKKDVPYLRLETVRERSKHTAIVEVYRVATQGGVAPDTCEGQPVGEVIAVAYKAQYWFYGSMELMRD